MSIKNFLYEMLVRKKITYLKKRNFARFGRGSQIFKPYLQLTGIKNISIGNGTLILNNARLAVYGDCDKTKIMIGDNTYIGFGFSALCSSKATIKIGDNVLFASNVLVTNENHGINPEIEIPYMNQQLTAQNVSIGDGCWIGEKVCILPGVTIGQKCIIGAGSVVTKSIPDYCIAAGNPAKVIKEYNFETHKWEKVNEKE